jgi:DNA repair protein SbcC/Rad50
MIRPNQKPSNEDIISYGSGESKVILEFTIEKNRYRVVREVHKTRPNRAALYELKPDGTSKPLATNPTTTTSEVERLLGGITYNEIVSSSVVAQKDLERLINQRLDDRRKVINVFLNLDSFNRVQEQLDQERSQVEGRGRTPGRLTLDRQQLESLKEKQKDHHAKEAQLSGLAEKVRKYSSDLTELEKQFADADRLYRTFSEYDEAIKNQQSLTREVKDKKTLADNLKQQLSGLTSQRSDLELAETKLKDYDALPQTEPQLAQASRLLDQLRGDQLTLGQLETREKGLKANLPDMELEYSETPAGHPQSSSKQVWTYLATTGALGGGAVLSFLLQLLLAAVIFGSLAIVSLILLARQIASLSQVAEVSQQKQEQLTGVRLAQLKKTELADIEKDLSQLRVATSENTGEILEALRSLPAYSARLAGIDNPREAFEAASKLYQEDKQAQKVLEERVKMLEEQLGREPALRTRLRGIEGELAKVEANLSSVKVPPLPDGIAFDEETLLEASQYRDSLNERVSRVRTQIEESLERQSEIRKELEENQNIDETVESQERKVRLLEKDLAVLKYSVKGLEQTSESLRNRVKPQVERYMSLILPVITSGRYKAVELEDDYTVEVFDPEAGEFKPKEVFSGGTEDQLLLAMRLAFALALIPQAKGKNPEFLFLDEPLGSSDRVRREGILALLRQELARNFRQIFLISHVGDLEAEADNVIQMENGSIREITNRKSSQHEQEQVPA